MQGSSVGGDVLDDNLLVVVELLSCASDHVAPIDSDLQVVEHCVVSVEQGVALSIQKRGRVTVHELIRHDSCVGEHSVVEDTHGFVSTQVSVS